MTTTKTPFTRFRDMHSGGGLKEDPFELILIEAPEAESRIIFFNRFGHNPDRITCTCCGPDYSIDEHENLESATAFERGCDYGYIETTTGREVSQEEAFVVGKGIREGFAEAIFERQNARYSFNPYMTLEQFLTSGKALLIRADEIKPEERIGDVPQQGYVWVD